MNKLFTLSLFALGAILTSNTFAATGTGHAQAELSMPLRVENAINIDFGTIAVDPAAGPQTLSMNASYDVVCPASYVCGGSTSYGGLNVYGEINTLINANITGQTATLSDGAGNTMVFDPSFHTGEDTFSATTVNAGGYGIRSLYIIGSIDLTGNEPAGTYSTENSGGSGYTVTVNY